jgi:hypothetical protein
MMMMNGQSAKELPTRRRCCSVLQHAGCVWAIDLAVLGIAVEMLGL